MDKAPSEFLTRRTTVSPGLILLYSFLPVRMEFSVSGSRRVFWSSLLLRMTAPGLKPEPTTVRCLPSWRAPLIAGVLRLPDEFCSLDQPLSMSIPPQFHTLVIT